MRIMLVISSLRRGGAERVTSILANHWGKEGRHVFLVTVEDQSTDAYSLNPGVTRIALNLARASRNPIHGFWNNLRRARQLRATARKLQPDVVVSLMTHTNLLTLLAMLGAGLPVVVSERLDPSQFRLRVTRRMMRSWLYPRAAAIVMQTERARETLQPQLRKGRFRVIPNPVPQADPDEREIHVPLRTSVHLPADAKVVVAMGRLDPQKGFDLLIEVFSKLQMKHPDWHLVIFGEGCARTALEAQVVRSGLADRVHMPGVVRAARGYLREADLFVLSSRFEGFPNVLLEAMACGLPVVSFDCPSGPGEIIRDGINGRLVEPGNVSAFEAAISNLMESQAYRHKFGHNARQVLEQFSSIRIMPLWDQTIADAITHQEHKA